MRQDLGTVVISSKTPCEEGFVRLITVFDEL